MRQEHTRATRKPKRPAANGRSRAKRTTDDIRQRAEEYAEEARDRAHATYDRAAEWVSGARENGHKILDRAFRASESGLRSASDTLQTMAAERPLTIVFAGLAAGFFLGAMTARYSLRNGEDDWAEEYEDEQ